MAIVLALVASVPALAQPFAAEPLALYAAFAPSPIERSILADARAALAPDARDPLASLDAAASLGGDVSLARDALAAALGPSADTPLVLRLGRAQQGAHADLPPLREPATLEDALRLLAASAGRDPSELVVPPGLEGATADAARRVVVAGLLLADVEALPEPTLAQRTAARDAALALALDAVDGDLAPLAASIELCPVFAFDLEGVDSTYECDAMVLLDVGGSDVYHNNAGGGGRESPAILVDLAGDDRYENMDHNESAFAGASDGTIGILADLAGSDTYLATFWDGGVGIGAAGGGAGVLYDAAGDDTYGVAAVQVGRPAGTLAGIGASLSGHGLLVDVSGDDAYTFETDFNQFGAGIGAAYGGDSGILYDGSGDDRYVARAGTSLGFAALGAGLREAAVSDAAVGVLIDAAGDDSYDTTGSVYFYGGVLGAGIRGAGALVDLEGADTFAAVGPSGTASLGAGAGERGVGLLYAGGGDSTYSVAGSGIAVGSAGGIGVLVDQGGSNVYASTRHCSGSSIAEAALPTVRSNLSAVFANGAAYVFGGQAIEGDVRALRLGVVDTGGRRPLDEIVRFDPLSNSSVVLDAALPRPRFDTAAAWTGGKAYVFGGSSAGGERLDEIVSFDPATGAVEILAATLPTPRARMAAVWTGSHVVLVGGEDADGPVDDILLFDPGSGTLTVSGALLPSPGLYGVHAAWYADRLRVFGGADGPDSPRDEGFVIDPVNGSIASTGASGYEGRYGGAVATRGGTMYIMGSQNATAPFVDVVTFDMDTGTAARLSSFAMQFPAGRPFGAAVDDGTLIYQFTDRDVSADDRASIMAFDPDGSVCPDALTQGAGAQLGIGLLIDRGDEARFELGAGMTGQGAGVQGVGILRREPQGGARLSTYHADAGAIPMGIAGAGVSLRLDDGFLQLDGELPDFTCGAASELLPTVSDGEGTSIAVCGRDESTRRALRDPEHGNPMQPVAKPAARCSDLPSEPDCYAPFADDETTRRAYHASFGLASHDKVTLTTEGGLAVLSGILQQGAQQTKMMKLNQMSADDVCRDWC